MKDVFSPARVEQLLGALGEQLEAAGEDAAIVIVGGAALSLLRVVARTTEDVDVIAIASRSGSGPGQVLRTADPFPAGLQVAIDRVTRDFGLTPDWINSMVALQWRSGLPPGFESRIEWRHYRALEVGLPSRRDLVFLKLFAAADQGLTSRHYADLIALRPTDADLSDAEEWVKGQDAAPEFSRIVMEVGTRVRADSQ